EDGCSYLVGNPLASPPLDDEAPVRRRDEATPWHARALTDDAPDLRDRVAVLIDDADGERNRGLHLDIPALFACHDTWFHPGRVNRHDADSAIPAGDMAREGRVE